MTNHKIDNAKVDTPLPKKNEGQLEYNNKKTETWQ